MSLACPKDCNDPIIIALWRTMNDEQRMYYINAHNSRAVGQGGELMVDSNII